MKDVKLGKDFFDQVDKIATDDIKVRFYYCVICVSGALNRPEVVAEIWNDAWERVVENMSFEEQFNAAQKCREALVKACGIMGAAKTGTSMRTLGKCIPEKLRDNEARRSQETQQYASRRGHAFHKRIYGRNPEFDMNATGAASPDYAFVVRDLLYGHIFSFDAILGDLETGYVVVSTLIGIDCQAQLRHHMKGMLYNGATREELLSLRDLCLEVVNRLGMKARGDPNPIPTIEDGQ